MDKLLDRIINFFENKSIHFGLRTSILIISIFVLFTCDYYFNFTYDSHLNNKIEKLKSINNLKNIYKSDSAKLYELTDLENRIYKRTHYSDRLRNIDLSQINIFKKSEKTEIINPIIKNDNTTINKPIISLFWIGLISNYFYIILVVVLFIMPFIGSVNRQIKNIIGSIAAAIILIGIISFRTWFLFKIPLILNNPIFNYILYFLLHTLFWVLVIIKGKNKKTNTNNI
jgi:hypothetical protein